MFNVISTFVLATVFACAIMYVNKISNTGLSLRGRRWLFVAVFLFGATLVQASINVFYTCDPKTNDCRYTWGNDPLITNGKGK